MLGAGKLEGVFSPSELFGQSEIIERLGLALPTPALIAKKLRDRGVSVTASDMDGLVQAVLSAKGGNYA